jgi:hypothetical protein
MEKQDVVIAEMKRQIFAYRQEIIELSTSKKHGKARRKLVMAGGGGGSDIDSMKVPRLDLSKVKRDSDDSDSESK